MQPSQPPLNLFGTTWHRGSGAKERMKSDAASMDRCDCQVQLQDPDSGARHFGCYSTWDDAIRHLRRLKSQQRHLFEIIPHGRPCKPYLDIDGPPLPTERFATVEDVVMHADRIVTSIFRNDYSVDLRPEHLVWLVSRQTNKLSLHLTVCTHDPQWLFSSNHQSDPTGASHLAQRVREMDPDGIGALVDVAVYTKDREMRVIGATKFGKSADSALELVRPLAHNQPITDALITCLDPEAHRDLLAVPGHIPRVVRVHGRELRSPVEATEVEPDEERSRTITRMLDLLRDRLHPSAYHDRRATEAPTDPRIGVKFNYRDRSEPCYTGHCHDGVQNMRCFVDASGDIHVKCFSSACSESPAFYLGRARDETDAWMSDAIVIDVPFLSLDESSPLSVAVDRWMAGKVHALSVRSPMGTGKSTMLSALVSKLKAVDPDVTILLATYRQSLAMEHVRKLRDHGFVSYLDRECVGGLDDRKKFPRIICQIESLRRLTGVHMIPRFDVVILDESESLLRHFASPTVRTPIQATDNFIQMAKMARRGIVTLDATWGAATWSVLRKAGISNVLVVNRRPPSSPRSFSFSNDSPTWMGQIVDDLVAGYNVVVVSLSAERAMEVHQAGVDAIGAERCLLHTSKTGDELKGQLADVDALWSKHQLVVYSPTIAAGVDFSTHHFTRMYMYVCAMSALPATALQMAFRVRKLEDHRVRGLIAANVRPSIVASRSSMTSGDMLTWLRWMATQDVPQVLVRVALPHDPVGGGGGIAHASVSDGGGGTVGMASLPPVSHWSLITSFVESERYNSQGDFLHCFARLAEAAGHTVSVDRIVAKQSSDDSVDRKSITAERMLAAEPVRTVDELMVLRDRVQSNRATEEDKWRLFVAAYKAGWGIDTIDDAFLAERGTHPGSPAVRLLARVLCPSLRRSRGGDTNLTERSGVFKVVIVEETLTALGFRSPFDDETVIPDLMRVFEQTLKQTPMFRDYKEHARLFRQGGSEVTVWDLNKVLKAINMVLSSVGLKIKAGREVSVGRDKTRKRTMVDYRLDSESVNDMVELVKLRLRRCGLVPPNEHARARLEACPLPRYAHLVSDAGTSDAFVDDEDD